MTLGGEEAAERWRGGRGGGEEAAVEGKWRGRRKGMVAMRDYKGPAPLLPVCMPACLAAEAWG